SLPCAAPQTSQLPPLRAPFGGGPVIKLSDAPMVCANAMGGPFRSQGRRFGYQTTLSLDLRVVGQDTRYANARRTRRSTLQAPLYSSPGRAHAADRPRHAAGRIPPPVGARAGRGARGFARHPARGPSRPGGRGACAPDVGRGHLRGRQPARRQQPRPQLRCHRRDTRRGVASFRPVRADITVARRLGVPRGELLLAIWQVDYSEDGAPVLSSYEYHLADAFEFTVLRRGPGRRLS